MLSIIQSFINSSGGGQRSFTYFKQVEGVAGFAQILDPIFKTFFQNNNFFFHTQAYQIVDQKTYKNAGAKLFS